MNFQIVFPTLEDAKTISIWRNDKLSLLNSFTYTKPKTVEEFFPEFLKKYFLIPSLPPLFIVENGEKVGLLRFDPFDLNKTEISLLIAPNDRGKGLGEKALKEIDSFLKRAGCQTLIARIKKENSASIKTFTKAGFHLFDESNEVLFYEKDLQDGMKSTSVFIIAEAGSNWKGGGDELQRALKLVDAAKEAGADAIKFQTFTAENTYVKDSGISQYLAMAGITENIFELFKTLQMPKEWIIKIASHAKSVGIEFMSSVFSIDDLNLIDPYVKRHKIASYEISHFPLLKAVAETKKPIILSTGASNLEEIDLSVDYLKSNGSHDITLLQCTAKYPAPIDSLNLRTIPFFKNRYQLNVGLSDHSQDPLVAPLAAVTLGGLVIEKHFTLDRSLSGPDHFFSITPKELKEMVKAIKETEIALGNGIKKVEKVEEELKNFAKRGIQALRDIQEGEILTFGENIAVLRPGTCLPGIHSKFLSEIEGKKSLRRIKSGEGIQLNDIKWS